MALIKARPAISLLLPAHVFAGDRVTAVVRLELGKPLEIERVDCLLSGFERVGVGVGNTRRVAKVGLLSLVARLSGAQTLPAGRTELTGIFELPEELPPSYTARAGSAGVQVEYVVTVHCAIPWWPDKRQEFLLVVRRRPQAVAGLQPSLHTTSTSGPRGREPHVEFSLSSRSLAPGGVLEGQLALTNVEHNRYRTATLSLVGMGTLKAAGGRRLGRVELHRYSLRRDLVAVAEGEAVPFAMKLPEELTPSHVSALWELEWLFDVELDIAWSKNLAAQVPITVLPPGSAAPAPVRRAAPSIGSERIMAIWRSVAESHGLVFDPAERRIEGSLGDVAVGISRSHRGADGIFLVAQLGYADLGLDLDGGYRSGLRRMLGGGVALGPTAWDRRHYLTGREEAQVAGFVLPLAELLVLHDLADMHDQALVLEVRDAGQSPKVLGTLVEAAVALAHAIPHARAVIPPPHCMHPGLDAWKRVARRLGGELATGPMAVQGQHEGHPVRLRTSWSPSGEPTHTQVSLQAPELLREGSELSWEKDGFTPGEPTDLAKPVRALIQRMVEQASSLVVRSDEITLQDSRAPILEEDVLWGRVVQLGSLASALRHGRGPYR